MPVPADGRIELDSNTVERTIRPIALKSPPTPGLKKLGVIASSIETCKLNSVAPLAWLTDTLTAIINGHKQHRIDELLPWNYPVNV